MVAFAQLLWGIPSGGLLLNVVVSTPSTPYDILAPYELGFRIPGGVEAAVHATRMYLHNLPFNKAIMKVEFENVFNSVRRDNVLCSQELHSIITALCPLSLLC